MTQPNEKIIHIWPNREKKIINFHCEKKIANFTADDFAQLEVKLLILQRFVGINQLISDAEMEMLKEFLSEELNDFSISEIEYSIKLAVAGHIEAKIDHWQAFTAQYLYPIFIKYRLLRSAVLSKYYAAEDSQRAIEAKANRPTQTEEELFLSNKKLCISAFDNFKLKISIIGMHKVFDILWELNLIPYTKEKMLQFEEMALAELKGEAFRNGSFDKTIYDAVLYSLKSKINLEDPTAQKTHPAEFELKLIGNNALIHKTKELATRNIFAYLVETQTEIETYFQSHNLTTNEK